jgi:hypothetical protein
VLRARGTRHLSALRAVRESGNRIGKFVFWREVRFLKALLRSFELGKLQLYHVLRQEVRQPAQLDGRYHSLRLLGGGRRLLEARRCRGSAFDKGTAEHTNQMFQPLGRL